MKKILLYFFLGFFLFSISVYSQEKTVWSNEDVLGESEPEVTEITVGITTQFISTNHSKAGVNLVRTLQDLIAKHGIQTLTAESVVYNTKGKAMKVAQRIVLPTLDLGNMLRMNTNLSDSTRRIIARSAVGGFQALGYIGDIGMMAYELSVAENDAAIAQIIVSTIVSSALITAAAYAVELAIPVAGVPMYIASLVANITAEIVISIVVDLVVRAIVYEIAY